MSTRLLADVIVPEQPALSAAATDLILVVGGALLVAAAAQLQAPLPFTPVPISGQTFGVALVSASLGMRRGVASMALYVVLGAIGLPFYSGGVGGWEHAFGATSGYLLGFVIAGGIIGWAAQKRADRSVWKAFLALQLGSVAIFVCGVSGLMLTLDVGLGSALKLGWYPFIPGDLIKTALAANILPAAWTMVERFRAGQQDE